MTLVTPWEKYKRLHVRSAVMPNDMGAIDFGFEADMDSHEVAFGIAYDFRQVGGGDNTVLIKYKHSFNGAPETGEFGLTLTNLLASLSEREVNLAKNPMTAKIHHIKNGKRWFEAVTR